MSSPAAPNMSEPMPCSPRLASCGREIAEVHSVLRFGSATAKTWPPRPPSPPFGPPILVLLVAERDTAIATVSGSNVDKGFVNETSWHPVYKRRLRTVARRKRKSHAARGIGEQRNQPAPPETTKPRPAGLCTASDDLRSGGRHVDRVLGHRTLRAEGHVPSTRANSVWSLPTPTFVPGWKRVPRWRTMDGAGADEFTTESLHLELLGLESRPFA